VMFHVKVFWVVTLCSVVAGYQYFRGLYFLHLQGEVGENGMDLYWPLHHVDGGSMDL